MLEIPQVDPLARFPQKVVGEFLAQPLQRLVGSHRRPLGVDEPRGIADEALQLRLLRLGPVLQAIQSRDDLEAILGYATKRRKLGDSRSPKERDQHLERRVRSLGGLPHLGVQGDVRRQFQAQIHQVANDLLVFHFRTVDRSSEHARQFRRLGANLALALGRKQRLNAIFNLARLHEQLQSRLPHGIPGQRADALDDTPSPVLKSGGNFVGPQDVSAIRLDEVLVLVEPVCVQFADQIGAYVVLARETGLLVEHRTLSSDLAAAVDADASHQLVTVRLLGVSHPPGNLVEAPFVGEARLDALQIGPVGAGDLAFLTELNACVWHRGDGELANGRGARTGRVSEGNLPFVRPDAKALSDLSRQDVDR